MDVPCCDDVHGMAAWVDEGGDVDARLENGVTLLMATATRTGEGWRRWCGCCCNAARASTCRTTTASPR